MWPDLGTLAYVAVLGVLCVLGVYALYEIHKLCRRTHRRQEELAKALDAQRKREWPGYGTEREWARRRAKELGLP